MLWLLPVSLALFPATLFPSRALQVTLAYFLFLCLIKLAHFHHGPFARYILPIDIHEAFSFIHLGLLQMLLSYLAPLSEVTPPSPCYSSFSNFIFLLLFITTGYYIVFYVNIFFFFSGM